MNHPCNRFSCPEWNQGQCFGGGCRQNPAPEREDEDGEPVAWRDLPTLDKLTFDLLTFGQLTNEQKDSMTDKELLKALAEKVKALEREVADLRKQVDGARHDAWVAAYDAALRR